jgi:hypothetical protein
MEQVYTVNELRMSTIELADASEEVKGTKFIVRLPKNSK